MTGSIGPAESYFVRLATGKVLGPLFRDDVLWLRGAEAIGAHTPVLAPGRAAWVPLGELLAARGEAEAEARPPLRFAAVFPWI